MCKLFLPHSAPRPPLAPCPGPLTRVPLFPPLSSARHLSKGGIGADAEGKVALRRHFARARPARLGPWPRGSRGGCCRGWGGGRGRRRGVEAAPFRVSGPS